MGISSRRSPLGFVRSDRIVRDRPITSRHADIKTNLAGRQTDRDVKHRLCGLEWGPRLGYAAFFHSFEDLIEDVF